MKYIVKAEIAVYDTSDDCNDVIRMDLKATSDDRERAILFGERLRDAVADIFDANVRTRQS